MRKVRVLACFTVLSTICGLSSAATAPAGWQTYHSSDYGFTVAFPKDFKFYSTRPDYMAAQFSIIPICDVWSVACFEYTGRKYQGTTFEASGISVNILRDARTEQECAKIDTGSYPIKKETIKGIHFRCGQTGGVAGGSIVFGPACRTFRENVCFELALRTAVDNTAHDDLDGIKQFDSTKLEMQLDNILHTFKFVGHVVDGPGWKVHYGSGCGGTYEYPESDIVATAIEYSIKTAASNGLTCEEYFSHHGLKYTVAAKVNVENKNVLDSWLKSSGYPGLDDTEVVVSSKYLTEYRAGPHYYIFGDGLHSERFRSETWGREFGQRPGFPAFS